MGSLRVSKLKTSDPGLPTRALQKGAGQPVARKLASLTLSSVGALQSVTQGGIMFSGFTVWWVLLGGLWTQARRWAFFCLCLLLAGPLGFSAGCLPIVNRIFDFPFWFLSSERGAVAAKWWLCPLLSRCQQPCYLRVVPHGIGQHCTGLLFHFQLSLCAPDGPSLLLCLDFLLVLALPIPQHSRRCWTPSSGIRVRHREVLPAAWAL